MRDYTNIDKYLDRLERDIYPQPSDPAHARWADESIRKFYDHIKGVQSVLDLGCGDAFCQSIFEELGISYTGVCLQRDFFSARESGKNVFPHDFSFLPYEDSSYDMLFSRHSLEHSPIPLLTIMEWHRVCKKYLAVVLPAPEYWGNTGRNHYFVLDSNQWVELFKLVGFDVVLDTTKSAVMNPKVGEEIIEYWFLLEKK